MDCWHAYVAGFFDGEGSVSIARNRANGLSDYHKINVTLTQRAKHRQVLDRVCEEFGGKVIVRNEQSRVAKTWAEQAVWQLQDKPSIARFLEAMRPHCIIKATQVEIGLEFLAAFRPTPVSMRDSLGRIQGKILSSEEIQNRERLRLKMRDANELGPPKAKPSTLPPLDVRHRNREMEVVTANPATVERGEKRYNSKLTEEAVREIRAQYAAGITKAEIARQHEVSFMLVSGIIRGTRWKHVT